MKISIKKSQKKIKKCKTVELKVSKERRNNAGIRITDTKKNVLIRKYGTFQKAIDIAIELLLLSEEIVVLNRIYGPKDEEY